MSRKKVFIEFSGIPGVGKTTLIEDVKKLLKNEENIQFVSNLDVDKKTVKSKSRIIKNIIPLIKTLYIVFLIKPKNFKSYIKFFKTIGAYQMFINEEKNNDIIQIYDEGAFRTAIFVAPSKSYKDPLDFINTLFKYIPKPDILVSLVAEPETIYKRRKLRNRDGNVDQMSYEELLESYKRKKVFNDKVLEAFINDIKIVELNNNEENDISKNPEKVVAILKDHLN